MSSRINIYPYKHKTLNLKEIQLLLGVVTLSLAGCNTPTASSSITSSHFSTTPYEQFECSELASERLRLDAAEQEFVAAQEKRIASSLGHALYYGWGKGDGLETVELAKIRGERDAVIRVQQKNKCLSTD